MASAVALFEACPRYVPESDQSLRDCSECREQFGEYVCPEWQGRMLKALGPDATLHQLRWLAHLRVSTR